jgi:hypothetical protein
MKGYSSATLCHSEETLISLNEWDRAASEENAKELDANELENIKEARPGGF